MQFISILESGTPAEEIALPDAARELSRFTAEHYARSGFVPPWNSYLAVEEKKCVGTCAFKTAPSDNRVEIAYWTFPPNEGKGIATRMAGKLVELARADNPALIVAAQTLPQENASTAVLKRLGFVLVGSVEHPEDGTVWEWQLPPVVMRREPTFLAGLSSPLPPRSAAPQERPRVIQDLSRAFLAKAGEIPNRYGAERYSIIEHDLDVSHGTPTIRIMFAVESFDGLPTWCERFTIPPGRYAVFEHRGPPRDLGKTVTNIHTTWLKHLPELFKHDPEIFVYPAGFDPADPHGSFQYWLPLLQ